MAQTLDNGNLDKVATYVGCTLWWRLPKIRIDHHALKNYARRHQVPDEFLPTQTTPISAFKRAVRHLLVGDSVIPVPGINDNQRVKLSKIKVLNSIRYGVVIETISEGKWLSPEQLGVIEFKNRRVFYEGFGKNDPIVTDVAKMLADTFKDFLCHTTDDIRGIITSFTKRYAISLRSGGGIYFVPDSSQDLLRRIVSLIEEINPKTGFYLDPKYVLTDNDLDAIRSVAIENLEQEITDAISKGKELLQELSDLTEKRSQNRVIRQLREFVETKDRITEFSQSLNFHNLSDFSGLNEIHLELQDKLQKVGASLSEDLKLSSSGNPPKPKPKPIKPLPRTAPIDESGRIVSPSSPDSEALQIRNKLLGKLNKYYSTK